MKKFFTLLFASLCAASVFAGDITIALPGNNDYQVLIDGRNVSGYSYHNNAIRLNNFQPGRHSMEVYRIKNYKSRGRNKAIYSSYFTVRPQYDWFITVNNNGRLNMDERIDRYGDRNDRRWNDNRRDDRYPNNGYDNRNNNYDKAYGNYRNAMSDYAFNQLVQRINSQWLGKLNAAKEAVNNNYLSTYQVRQVMQLFTSNNERLDLAKQAYRNTVDPQNYNQLNNLLSYPAQRELNDYINNYRY